MDELVREFLVESYEGIDQLDRDLVSLEEHPTDTDLLARIFRCIHTVKGTCGFLAFGKLESLTHTGENLLSLLRDGKLSLNPEITTALLHMVDAVRDSLAVIEATEAEGDADYTELIQELTRLQATDPSNPPAAPKPKPSEPKKPKATTDSAPPAACEQKSAGLADTAIRVDVHLLDKLMNLVGELVLARNQILQHSSTSEDTAFLATTQRLNLVTTELQGGVMKTRMQPIKTIWSKFPRVVRDLSRSCGKSVSVDMEGEGTELDKTIIEAIKDPLTHVIRNSVDHGIESPETRAAHGKNPEGRLQLRAFHEGGQVIIEIQDDGGGINPEKVKAKAIERALITPEQASRMPDREAVKLIFRPGFSTAEKVTNVSGRGVGMDVVRTNIEKIGGTVDVLSQLGEGTTLRVKIPLTLAIIPALVVTCSGSPYAIPQVNLLELVRLEGEQIKKIEHVHGAPIYRLRGNLLPLVYLNEALEIVDAKGSTDEEDEQVVNVVVLQADDRQFGLVVEGVSDTEEIVVKPLSRQLKGIPAFAGATVRGDGNVALILDVIGLAQKANVLSEVHDSALSEATSDSAANNEKETLLLFRIGEDERMAIPLQSVARLEEIQKDTIERSGDLEIVQYRDEIMPVARLSTYFGAPSPVEETEALQMIVHSHEGRSVGLIVDHIEDIVEEKVTVSREVRRRGISRSVVVQGRVTHVVDLPQIVTDVDPVYGEELSFA